MVCAALHSITAKATGDVTCSVGSVLGAGFRRSGEGRFSAGTLGVYLVVGASGVVGATAGCAPVGSATLDHLLTGAVAAVVALAAVYASGAALIAASLIVAAGGSPAMHLVGVVAVLATTVVERRRRSTPVAFRAFVGALIVQALLRLPWTSPARGSAAIASLAILVILMSSVRGTSADARRVIRRSALIVGAIALTAAIASLYAIAHSHTLLQAAAADTRAAVDAARSGDRQRATDAFATAQDHFDGAKSTLESWVTWPGRQLPIVGPQLRVIDRVASIGAHITPIARSSVTTVDPDRLRLVDGRLDLATIASYRPIFDRVAAETRAVRDQLARIPRMWLAPPLDHHLARFEATIAKADDDAHTADEAVTLAPSLLGASGARTYLVAIVTPAESRGSGGLMANYGVLTVSGGRLRLSKVGRGGTLNVVGAHPKRLTGPRDYLARYGRFEPAQTWQNVTMSPDFPSVGEVMAQLYPQSGGAPIDGVIRVDPVALAGLLSLTGPVRIPGLPVTLNAQNAVPFLLRDEYALIADRQRRADLLGDIARAVFDRLTSGRSARPSAFGNALSPAIRTANLALWLRDARGQAFVRNIGADAGLPPFRGDSFGVVVQNGGGNKIDNYLQRIVRYEATVSGTTGHVSVHAEVGLHNDAPTQGVPLSVIGNELGLPVGTSRLYVSIYSPFALRNASLDARPLQLDAESELGRRVYSAFVDIPAGKTRTMVLDLDGSVDLSSGQYHFDYLAQVLPNADRVNFSVHTPDAHVVGVTVHAAAPVRATTASRSASVTLTSARGPWTVDLSLRR